MKNYTFKLVADKHQGDRDEQQDAYFIANSRDGRRVLCVVADGMGGHRGGRKASACVVTAAKMIWQQTVEGAEQEPPHLLNAIVQQAYKMMLAYEEEQGISPRSTCVMLLISDHHAYYCHLGDSRLYHFRQQKLLTRTKDHSVVQMLVDMDTISEEEMGTHEEQGHLLKWLGGKESPPEATFHSAAIEAGDQFLLCSDGIWEYVSTSDMENAWQSSRTQLQIAKHFIQQARQKSNGKGDNIALILCNVPDDLSTGLSKQQEHNKRWLLLAMIGILVLMVIVLLW